MTLGGVMLASSLGQISARSSRCSTAPAPRWRSAGDLRAAVFHRVQDFSPRVGKFGAPSLITRTTNDVQQVQCWAAHRTLMVTAPIIVRRRDHHGAEPGRALSRCC